MLDETQLEIMSSKVAEVLGQRTRGLSAGQKRSLEHALVEVLEDNNFKADKVTSEEIEGAYSVMEAFYPADSLELSERYQALQTLSAER